MRIEERESVEAVSTEKITFKEEGLSGAQLRLVVTFLVTILIIVILIFDGILGFWQVWFYWLNFLMGIILSGFIIGLLLQWNTQQQKKDRESWLNKWGDEIGWPLMILAFTIQFFLPQLRPFILGAILTGSWLIVLWQRRQ